jgi:hypothetical protein
MACLRDPSDCCHGSYRTCRTAVGQRAHYSNLQIRDASRPSRPSILYLTSMSILSRAKKQSKSLSTSAAASRLASQQSEPLYPWSAHAPPIGQSPSPFLRNTHALSTSATTAGELFLFGGYEHSSRAASNDLYVFSTRYFSATLLQASGDIPGPRYGHTAVLTGTTLLIWGGTRGFTLQNAQTHRDDDSLSLLNLGTSDLLGVKTRPS